jgi:hypothetical protein
MLARAFASSSHVQPLSDDGIGTVSGLDDISVLESGPSSRDLIVRIEELLFAPRLHFRIALR